MCQDHEKPIKKDSFGKRIELKMNDKLSQNVERRGFLKGLGGLMALATVATSAVGSMTGAKKSAAANLFEDYFQKHYKEMSPEEKLRAFERIEAEAQEKYGVAVKVHDPSPLPNVKYAYALSLSKCNGSRRCVEACNKENNISPDSGMQYIKVVEMDIGTMNLEKGNMYYEGESVPKEGKFYMPIQCHQCDNPPCTKVCPIEATWKEKDGIVVIDYNWCIGCRYCMAACPYEARHFNFSAPKLNPSDINPNQSYLSNRVRPVGVVEKCTFCLHRTREGSNPACLEACPTGARVFGNILDPESEVSKILKTKRVYILKEELNTVPSFFYYFD